jgi:nicotinate (nicotinamide) nucleotide adenylyltransferase
MKKIKLGIDIHQVGAVKNSFFSELSRLLVENGHEVHLLTEEELTPALEKYLREDLRLSWTRLFSVTSYQKSRGVKITYIQGSPYMDEEIWNRTKADYCREQNLDLHIDRSDVYGRHFTTPYARFYERRIPRRKTKVAIMGGSFNPITHGHLKLGETVLEKIPDMNQVWMMPAFRHPFQKHDEYAEQRIRMIRMVETERLRYFSYEIDHKLSGETYVTFNRLLQDPGFKDIIDFHMVVGSDCVLEFDDKWKHADLLARMVTFIIVPRPGYDLKGYDGLLSRPPHIHLTDADMPDISSTKVRQKIRCGESVEGMVPEPVRRFIRKHHLYEGECDENPDPQGDQPPTSRNPPNSIARPEPGPEKPRVSVNIAVCTIRDEALQVLLVKRKSGPCSESWAIPGGFLEAAENPNLEETVTRRLEELVHPEGIYLEQLKTYDPPDHTPLNRMITTAYFALIPEEKLPLKDLESEGDSETAWFSLKEFQKEAESRGDGIVFGHDRILQDLLTRIQGKISYTPIAFELVPKEFTWPELRRVFEIVLGKDLDATNFKRKIRSAYRIADLKSRPADKSVGRPPNRHRFDGIKDPYL